MIGDSHDSGASGVPKLRRAGRADVDAVRGLTREAYARWVPVLGREPKPMRADYARAVRDHRIDLLEIDGALAGLIELVAASDHLLVENVAIAPPHQGRGLGRRLLRHAETVAAGAGLPRIRLYTNRLMAANVALYTSLGYALDRAEVNERGTVLHMSKPVSAA